MDKILYIVNRFKEPSTWGSIAATAALLHYQIDPGTIKTLIGDAGIISGLLGVFVSEAKPK